MMRFRSPPQAARWRWLLWLAFISPLAPSLPVASAQPRTHVPTVVGKSDGKPLRAWLAAHALSLSEQPSEPPTRHVAVLAPARLLKQLDSQPGAEMIHALFGDKAAELPSVTLVALPDSWERQRFPPQGDAYQNSQAVAHALWRWLPLQGFDFLIELRSGQRPGVQASKKSPAQKIWGKDVALLADNGKGGASLTAASGHIALAGVGTIPGAMVVIDASSSSPANSLAGLDWSRLPPSAATLACRRRLARDPQQLLAQLSEHYGDAPALHYIPALACIARLRFEHHQGANAYQRRVSKWIADKPWKEPRNGSEIAGRLLLEAWLKSAPKDASPELRAIAAKELQSTADLAFDEQGQPRAAMPFHSEMSDAVFMAGPILAVAGRRFKREAYHEACLRHVRFMQGLCLRDDGLYRHHPGNEAAWGRGNGFPALGLALALSEMPPSSGSFDPLKQSLLAHLRTLQKHQDPDGAFHQIIDRPEAYRELTSTCMITFAMQRCERRGWCRAGEFRESIKRAWRAIRLRAGEDGKLIDVCTGTGKQKQYDDYFLRKAILGKDPRGGAMAMTATLELLESRP